jgi:hypothetical protein
MADAPWRPTRPTIIAIGLLTLWPFVYMGLFMASIAFSGFIRPPGTDEPGIFRYIFPLHCLTMLLIFALIAIYIFHAFKTDRIDNDKRVLWVVILFLGNMVAFPVYWYLYMWREEPARGGGASQ